MKIKHNKKRNLGIIFEQLNQELSNSIIFKNENRKKVCLQILKENFKKDSELYKELRLFLSLSNIKIVNESLIHKILNESKIRVSLINKEKLSSQKSKLIKSINENLGPEFFNIKINNYNSLATIQVLIENWKINNSDFVIHSLEDKLITEIKSINKENENSVEIPKGLNTLVLEMAQNKFFEKYKNLSKNQLKILFEFFAVQDKNVLFENYEKLKIKTLKEINNFLSKDKTESSFFIDEMKMAKLKIEKTSFLNNEIEDKEKLKRAIIISKLCEDLLNE